MITIEEVEAHIKRVEDYRQMSIMDQLRASPGFTAAERDAWKAVAQFFISHMSTDEANYMAVMLVVEKVKSRLNK